MEVAYPQRIDILLAQLPQLLSMYLLICLVSNLLAILAPMPIRAGTMKPMNPKMGPMLLHVFSMLFYPILFAPVMLPLGIQFAVDELTGIRGLPIALVLSLGVCVAVVFVYRAVLTWEGQLLRRRELKILEAVTTKAE